MNREITRADATLCSIYRQVRAASGKRDAAERVRVVLCRGHHRVQHGIGFGRTAAGNVGARQRRARRDAWKAQRQPGENARHDPRFAIAPSYYLSLYIWARAWPTLYSGELLSDKADLACRMDDDFLLRFLRARRFCVERAYTLVSCTPHIKNSLMA